jgi:1,4-alpha-glucan branching enzyme
MLLALCGTAHAQSLRPGLGAMPYADAAGTGVTFRVWAPQAGSVSVAGTFNGWSMTAHPLARESVTSGVWSADVPAARTNHSYKYVVNGALWRSDPRARRVNAADNNNSIVTSTNGFNWAGDAAAITNAGDLVIYEAHVGTWAGPSGTFSSFSNRLDHLRDLGISAIELMPINEFPSATSWGYNPAYPFALETDYGTPDTLRGLVRGAHRRGMVTLLDVVHNHWDGGSSLWQFDGGAPGPYFYANDPYAFTWWGPRPDYSRADVRNFINDTFRMWLDEYHISGFRWDAPRHIIYTTNDVPIPDGLLMVTNALSLMAAAYPGTWNIAEDTKEISGFNYSWDLTFHWEIKSVLTQTDDAWRDMPTVARNVGGGPGRIIFTESHDTAGDLNGGERLPTAIHGGDPAGYYARKRSALGAALVMTSPGTPMILQGQELLETNQFSDTRPMDWARTNAQAGTLRLYRDLIRLRRNLDGVSPGLMGDAAAVYQVDNANKLIAYSRWDSATTGDAVVVVANFANAVRAGFPVRFPEAGTWFALFNSDSTNYAPDYGNFGSVEVAAAGDPPGGLVDIGPYSALVFSRTPRSGMVVLQQTHLDQPAGNADGVLDPGETIRSRLVLWNKSQVPATNVSAHLASDTPGVIVQQAASPYPEMPPDGTGTNAAWFEYRVAATQTCGSVLSLRLITSFNGRSVTSVLEHVVGQYVEYPPATNVFLAGDVPKPIADYSTTYSTLTIDEPGSNTVSDIDVQVRVNHTYDRDLTLALQHPDGSEVILAARRGGSGDNFGTGSGACTGVTYTVFDRSAATLIRNGAAPFAGAYRPEGSLATFNGKPLNGTWRLRMRDQYANNTGTALCWGIRATYEQRALSCNSFSNRPPVAHATNLWLFDSAPAGLALGGSDEDGQPVTFETRSAPAHGLFNLISTTHGQAVYAPVHGYVGTDAFDFVVADGLATSLPATVTLVMQPPVDADTNGLPDAWEQAHFTNEVLAAPGEDVDGDGADNLSEYLAHTDPRDSNSVLRLHQLQLDSGGCSLWWTSVGGTRYRLEHSAEIDATQSGAGFQPLPRPLEQEVDPAPYGAPSAMSFLDPVAPAGALRAYRVRALNE